MFLLPKIEDLVFKYNFWRFETHLSGWGWLLEAPNFWFVTNFCLGFIFFYHWKILNLEAYLETRIQGTYSKFFKIVLKVTPTEHPIGTPKLGYTLWSCINLGYKNNGDRPFVYPNQLGFPSLLTITKNHCIFLSTCVKITLYLNQLAFIIY